MNKKQPSNALLTVNEVYNERYKVKALCYLIV